MLSPAELFTSSREIAPGEWMALRARFRSVAVPRAYLHPWPRGSRPDCGVGRIVRIEHLKLDGTWAWYVKVEGDVRLHAFDPAEQRIIVLEPVATTGV